MTANDFKKLTPEELIKLPWDAPVMLVVPGRYYRAIFCVRQPGNPALLLPEADYTGLLWCYDGRPDVWHISARLRFYSGTKNPWDGTDTRQWFPYRLEHTTEAEAVAWTRDILQKFSGIGVMLNGSAPWQWIDVGGDCAKYCEVIERERPEWLHAKSGPILKR